MKDKCVECGHEPTNIDKWRWTLMTTIIFLIVVNPFVYKCVQSCLGSLLGRIASKDGCPTMLGILVHSVVFTLLLRGSMEMKI